MDKMMRQCYARYMRIANKAINDYYTEMLKPTGCAIVQFSILSNVAKLGCCGVGELAEEVELDYTTVTRSIKPLIERGYMTDETESKGRKRSFRLTEEGLHVVEIGTPLWEGAQAHVRELLGEDEVNHLKETLSKLETIR